MKNIENEKHLLYAVRIILERKEINNIWESHKWVINDLIERLAKQDSNLLLQLINNPIYHAIADSLLGFSRILLGFIGILLGFY